MNDKKARFELGCMVFTRRVSDWISGDKSLTKFTMECLRRHVVGDWGDLSEEDKRENEYSLGKYLRLLSAYKYSDGTKIWIVTEADRQSTTVLFPDEY